MGFFKQVAQAVAAPKRASRPLSFSGFSHGLRTAVPAFQITKKELAELVNYKINKGGQLEPRPGISRVTSAATTGNSAVKAMAKGPIGASSYTLLTDAANKLYYLDSAVPTEIGALSGAAQLLPFKGVILALDGSYLKYLASVAAISLCYDNGTGAAGYQFINLTGADSGSLALGNGTNTRIAYKFTSQAWDAGFTIPPTTVTFKLQREGNGFAGTDNVAIVCRIRKVADDSEVAEKTLVAAPIATNVSDTAAEYSATFASGDITAEFLPGTAYYVSLEYANGDATNYVHVRTSTVSSGGAAYHYAAAAWTQDATQDPIAALRPGRPPKGAFGTVDANRPFIAGDPDHPGWMHFGNGTYLDWSTADGGGWVGAIDDGANSFAIGGIAGLYGDIFVYGKKDQPYLCKLTGASPSAYSLPRQFQNVWATHKTLLSLINDIWSASADGVDPLTGVQEYGDMRAFSASDPVKDRFLSSWDTNDAIAGYYPKDGQYFIAFPNYHRVLVCHTKIPAQLAFEDQTGMRYPWTEYEFYRDVFTRSAYRWTASPNGTNEYYLQTAAGGDPSIATEPDAVTINRVLSTPGAAGSLGDHQWDYADEPVAGAYKTVFFRDNSGDPDETGVMIRSILIPQSFATIDGTLYMGGSDGHVYKLDTAEYKDLSTHRIDPRYKTAYVELPFASVNLEMIQLLSSGKAGAGLTIEFYTDGMQAAPVLSIAKSLPAADNLTKAELTMDKDDALFTKSPLQTLLWETVNIDCRSVQVGITDLIIPGYPVYHNGLTLKYRPLEI